MSPMPSSRSATNHLQLFIAGNVIDAGQEEEFPDPDNHSKMRRSVENAEHVGLYIPIFRDHWYPAHNPGALAYRHGRRAGRFDYDHHRPGHYLPPARIMEEPERYTIPHHRRIPSLVDTRSPYDPFAGRPFA